MKVQVYAVLKEYFHNEFEIDQSVNTIRELNAVLLDQNPVAEKLLHLCRFAVNDEFVDNNFQLNPDDVISIIPPSSGG